MFVPGHSMQRLSPNKRRSEGDACLPEVDFVDSKSGPTPVKRPALTRIEEARGSVKECGQTFLQHVHVAREEKLKRQERLQHLRELVTRESCLTDELQVQLAAVEQEFAERASALEAARREELQCRLSTQLTTLQQELRIESNRRVALARREQTALKKLKGLKIDASAPKAAAGTSVANDTPDDKEKLLREQLAGDLEALEKRFAAREAAELAEVERAVKEALQAEKEAALRARRMAHSRDVGRVRRDLGECRRALRAEGVIRSELGFREQDLLFDWNASRDQYEDKDRLDSCVEAWKRTTSGTGPLDTSYPDVTFTAEQQQVLDLVNEQIESLELDSAYRNVHKRCIVQGKAGSGKSTLIKAITATVSARVGDGAFLLAAPTGVAAINIGGATLHSTFRLPLSKKKFAPLCEADVERLAETMRRVRFIIIDEYSMIGCMLLGMVAARCKQLMPASDEPFGGCFTYLFGDIRQLPPVGDWPLYTESPVPCKLGESGRLAFESFTKTVLLTVSQRQADDTFREALDRLSQADTSDEDYALFCRRFLRNVGEEERSTFFDAVRLYFKNKDADEYNKNRLRNMKCPVALIPAQHNYAMAAAASKTEAHGLPVTLYLARGARVMLRKNLWVGAGLVNGAVGTVVDLVYPPGRAPPEDQPDVVMVRFDHYHGPRCKGDAVPIPSIEERWHWERNEEVILSRRQFPLALAWAVTIHKAQGLSLSKVVLNLGDEEKQPGLTYVGISRSRTWDGLIFEVDFPKRRLTYFKWDERLKERIEAEKKLFCRP